MSKLEQYIASKNLEENPHSHEKINIPAGANHILNKDFDIGPELFEKLCFHIIDEKYDVLIDGKYNILTSGLNGQRGSTQNGFDIYAKTKGSGSKCLAFECKHRTDKIDKKLLRDSFDRFLQRANLSEFSSFVLISNQSLKTSKRDEISAVSELIHRINFEYQEKKILFEFWDKQMLMRLLSQMPSVAGLFLEEQYCDELTKGFFYEKEKEDEIKRINERKMNAYNFVQINKFYDVPNIEEPEITIGNSELRKSFLWSNNFINLNASLPFTNKISGNCALTIKAMGYENTIFTLSHDEILNYFYLGQNSKPEECDREFILNKIEENTFLIELRNTRLFMHENIAKSLCDAIDSLMPHYIKCLEDIENRWDAYGFTFNHQRESAPVYLFSLDINLWNDLMSFTNAHDSKKGNTAWHIFDTAGQNAIRPYTKNKSDKYASGSHGKFIPEPVFSFNGFNADRVNILWSRPNGHPQRAISSKEFWGARQAYNWFVNELIPTMIEWKFKTHLQQFNWIARTAIKKEHKKNAQLWYGEIGFSEYDTYDKPIDILTDFEQSHIYHVVSKLQMHYSSLSDNKYFVIAGNLYKELLLVIEMLLEKSDIPYIDYLQSKLMDSGNAESKQELCECIMEKCRNYNEEKANNHIIENTFRALLQILNSELDQLTTEEESRVIETLNEFTKPLNDYLFVKRHTSFTSIS